MAMTLGRDDSEIQQDVLQELRWAAWGEAPEVGVAVDHGVVMLTGAVNSYARKIAAQEAAHRVKGVQDVANDLEVKIASDLTRTDTEIAHAARRALEWDVLLPHQKIQTSVADGWVTLEGTVSLLVERQRAERDVRDLWGVRGVTNAIVVEAPHVDPTAVKETIERALARRAEREAERIEVSVAGGVVALHGRVRTWDERREVVDAVTRTPGVRQVEDELSVEPRF